MASNHVNVLLDDELYFLVVQHSQQRGVTLSAALRDLLRHGIGVVASTQDAGWREGYMAAWTAVRKAAFDSIENVSPTYPVGNPMIRG
jgi:hypothetical protein